MIKKGKLNLKIGDVITIADVRAIKMCLKRNSYKRPQPFVVTAVGVAAKSKSKK